MTGFYIPKGTLAEVCDCGVAVYRFVSGEQEVIADCERAGCVRPKGKLGGAGYLHEHAKEARTA